MVVQGLWPNWGSFEAADSNSASRDRVGIVCSMEGIGGHADGVVGLQESFIEDKGMD